MDDVVEDDEEVPRGGRPVRHDAYPLPDDGSVYPPYDLEPAKDAKGRYTLVVVGADDDFVKIGVLATWLTMLTTAVYRACNSLYDRCGDAAACSNSLLADVV